MEVEEKIFIRISYYPRMNEYRDRKSKIIFNLLRCDTIWTLPVK
jgi:hypothetical protein